MTHTRPFECLFLEGELGSGELGSASLRGVLDMLKSCGVVDEFTQRDVLTVAEFEKLVRRWVKMTGHDLAYFASHGSSGRIWLDDEGSAPLARLGDSCRAIARAGSSTWAAVPRSTCVARRSRISSACRRRERCSATRRTST